MNEPVPGDLSICRNCREPIEYKQSSAKLLGTGWYHVDSDDDDEPMFYALCRIPISPRAEPIVEAS